MAEGPLRAETDDGTVIERAADRQQEQGNVRGHRSEQKCKGWDRRPAVALSERRGHDQV